MKSDRSEDSFVPFVMVRAAAACGVKHEEGLSVVINDGCVRLATAQSSSSSSPLRMEGLNEWFWQEEFWLPPGTRWQDFRVKDHPPSPRDLLYTLPLAFAFIALRYVFERLRRTCLHPFSKCFFSCCLLIWTVKVV